MLIVAVSGVTNGGKSTLAEALQNALPKSVLICQDTYFLPKESEKHVLIPELNHFNWEIMSSLDMDKMLDDINYILRKQISPKTKETESNLNVAKNTSFDGCKGNCTFKAPEVNSEILNEAQVLIIEGFLVLNCQRIVDLCHLKYHLTLSKEECYNRRITRDYDPPDVPGYFEKCVWPEYVRHKEEMLKAVGDVKVIDGTRDIHSILNEVLGDIADKLKSSVNSN